VSDVDAPVAVEVVRSETEAEMLCQLLRTAGITCGHRDAENMSEGFLGWREVLVGTDDVERAREVLATQPSAE
jgi:Putative prokaryotic signal transducing protein